MVNRRFQNKIAESGLTLPIACIVATLLWWLPDKDFSVRYMAGWVLCALTTYIIIETANTNALLRIRSRMVSTTYVFLAAAFGFLHPIGSGAIMALALSASLRLLFASYEQRRSATPVFYAYLCLSLGSLTWMPFLWLTPILMAAQGIFLRSLSWRTTGAALCGLLLPYWLWLAAAPFTDTTDMLLHHLLDIRPGLWQPSARWTTAWQMALQGDSELWKYLVEPLMQHPRKAAAAAYTGLLGFTGAAHYLRNSYDDKIRVRMCHYTLLITGATAAAALLLCPRYFGQLFPLLILCSTPSAAHLFSLTHTWFSNAWFVICLLLWVAVAALNLLPLTL